MANVQVRFRAAQANDAGAPRAMRVPAGRTDA